MPYSGEVAGKSGHSDFVKNPDVVKFLGDCNYLRQPSDEEAKALGALFHSAPRGSIPMLPRHVVASDASKSDRPISDKLPSTQIGFLKISHVLINMQSYGDLINPLNRFVDPFKAAEIHREAHPITFTMPGSNVCFKNNSSVKNGFRQALYERLKEVGAENGSSLIDVLKKLERIDGNKDVAIRKCPNCSGDVAPIAFKNGVESQPCALCNCIIYVTDSLRLHEGISDFGDNSSAMTRMMNAMEHLLLAAFILSVSERDVSRLSDLAFIIDGPLAVFGEPAKLAQRLQRLIFTVNEKLSFLGLPPLLVLGLQKTGGLMDHAKLIERFVDNGSIRAVDDEYRHMYVTGADSPSDNFGNETYYGQDFLFKTESGRIFNFAIPYPFFDKTYGGSKKAFANAKIEESRYGSLINQACDLIRHFEMDLYESAIVPIALAHRHASISVMPGGKVLDLIVRGGLNGKV
ncbi:DNA double-strand break repair nuclease NurA [Xanthomonas oryzae]|uniref:DNA double-strand break repair nuclease NurA n=1 Tax=Xanthomonas oryzae TaxID=347 RepID=UPI0010332524|nr:DNA double-strand break repair nuclease NurA [Xanthomonas oryzae]QBG87059.1 hypothetical protein EYC54_03920 [Xanthomonas oryzae]